MDPDPPAESSKRRTTRTLTKKRKSDPADAPSAPAPKRARGPKKGRLAGLLNIPLDILFEILGNLHPLDLLRLSRTSKDFRQLLMQKSSRHIWRSSLNTVDGMPPCPPNMNEPQWISLAFDAVCQVCHKIARKVDWGLFIRICGKCAKSSLQHHFLGIGMGLVSGSTSVDFSKLIPSRPDHHKPFNIVYFPPAFESVKKEYNAIVGADEKEKFIEERKELVKTLAEHTILCEEWSENVADNRSAELADRKEERYTAIVARLTDLGWGPEIASIMPIDSLRLHKSVKLPNTLTDRTWNTIKPEMIKYMEEMKKKRLDREHVVIVNTRKALATKVLRTFKRSQLPWSDFMPNGPDFCDDFPRIKEIIVQPSSVTVNEQTFEALLPDFPGMIATWREGLRERVANVYKTAHDDETLSASDLETRLNLATTVFKCVACSQGSSLFATMMAMGLMSPKRCQPLFYPNILAHECWSRNEDFSLVMMFLSNRVQRDHIWNCSGLRLDSELSDVVAGIVKACGMNPKTTTVEEMDAADARFACHACAERGTAADPDGKMGSPANPDAGTSSASKDKGKGKGKASAEEELEPATVHAYNWRNAVRHHGEKHLHFPTEWYKLSDADAVAARSLEAQEIIKAKEVDKVNAANDSEDSEAAADDEENEPMPPVEVTVDTAATLDAHPCPLPSQLPAFEFCCAHCIDTPSATSPLTYECMMKHLRGRHDLLTPPVLNEDYYRALAAPEIYGGDAFPAPELKTLIPPKPDSIVAPPTRLSNPYLDHYLYDSDEGSYDSYEGYDDYGDYW
ncbi:F-box domain-containing protein [Favolaschia claudopus]|uniref:F-box domain-containing protein n=1 Tax=Favolaschia claudopus TaxID=2862362 RepID=A0AAW0EH68_9AGAR